MIIDCISDLHGHYPQLEGGDLLIIAGDLTLDDSLEGYNKFYNWISYQKYRKKVYIGGNHDMLLEKKKVSTPKHCGDVIYLLDSGTEFEGLKIWGSPWTLTFEAINPKCTAFTCENDEGLAKKWALIPDDTDILITHMPPNNLFDRVNNPFAFDEQECHVGSRSLLSFISNNFQNLRIHVFGHIHESYGIYDIREAQKKLGDPLTCVYVNASHVNENYKPVNKPVRIIL